MHTLRLDPFRVPPSSPWPAYEHLLPVFSLVPSSFLLCTSSRQHSIGFPMLVSLQVCHTFWGNPYRSHYPCRWRFDSLARASLSILEDSSFRSLDFPGIRYRYNIHHPRNRYLCFIRNFHGHPFVSRCPTRRRVARYRSSQSRRGGRHQPNTNQISL